MLQASLPESTHLDGIIATGVRRTFHVPTGMVNARCVGCNAPLLVPRHATPPMCAKCERGQAVASIGTLLADVTALRNGTGIFAGMTRDERDEQLAALGLPTVCQTLKYPGFRKLTDSQLIDIVANPFVVSADDDAEVQVAEAVMELCRRLDSPTDDERDDIEGICGQMDAVNIIDTDPEGWTFID